MSVKIISFDLIQSEKCSVLLSDSTLQEEMNFISSWKLACHMEHRMEEVDKK